MAKQDKRQKRAKQKAKQARLSKQKVRDEKNYADFVYIQEPMLSLFKSLPLPNDDFEYIVPIVNFAKAQFGKNLYTEQAVTISATYLCWGLHDKFTTDDIKEMTYILAANPDFTIRLNNALEKESTPQTHSNEMLTVKTERPLPETTYVSTTPKGMRFYVEDVIGEEDDDFYLVMLIDEENKHNMDAAGDELTASEWTHLVEKYSLVSE
ncbi:hypothetical protein LFR94_004390 [Vibrio vulnificus]|jgi:hypothetical protein|uniref:hypothetical protein n=1 Tax=Gammaproteobacteria TaxID=1236 RepID=UPI000362A949|nr:MULTISPECIES: hypothetical protein [Vibrio]EWS67243.1 hypothetical protein Y702_21900 [Vibrio vulnificus BAA87]BDP36337.1 hypothetical protein VA208B3_27080 [Vibrio alginolyticus]EGQ7957895.1 hypothetical protein [Vibrio vulnificus]EGQ7989029.1 hypothetical protein [Vibrio vulnificus]EGQ9240056.1 hypothetical protein [Vibrio vulnificus]